MSHSIFIIFLFIAIATVTTAAKEYFVGNHVGWRIPPPNETEIYTIWASRRRFYIGDTLRFRYSASSVVQVDKYGFYHCDSTHPISFSVDGNTVVKLDKVGTVYFISGNSERCSKGQRMIVNVNNVRQHYPPAAHPPCNQYYSLAPSPSQGYGSGSGAGAGAGALLDSGSAVLASASVMALVVALAGLGLCLVEVILLICV
ncbi:putative Phytocyanin domain, cupredoxin [Helianthus annuus]|nr:putative Phytocyanin domain, cupredoxin [Helianthus annuus]